MRKIYKKLLIIGLASMLAIPCSAKSSIDIYYNEQEMYLEQEAKLIDNSVLLPLRTISQYFGYRVNWDPMLREVNIIAGNTKIILAIDSHKASINGEEAKLTVPAQMIDGITYVPLRFVGEALDLEVVWDSNKQTVHLEGKYTVDKENKKLLVRTKEGKKVLANLITLSEYAEYDPSVGYTTTKNGSEIVSVSQIVQGAAATGATCTNFYIKDEKIIDKIERPFHYRAEEGICYLGDEITLGYGRYLRTYNDQTGVLIKKYDLNSFQEGLTLDLMKIGKNYAMGRYEKTIHVIDFQTGKVTRILDLIPIEDQGYVFQSDMHLDTDNFKLVWETDTELVFKYHSITEGAEKTVICPLGQ